MKIRSMVVVILLIVIAAGAFLTGAWVNHVSHRSKPGERKILYYLDPMNPSYRSDKPGIAPGCGMPLEPVYANENGSEKKDATLLKSMPAGTIKISAERQQLIGVKEMVVEKVPWTHTVRVLGRVTPDENRIYRINAALTVGLRMSSRSLPAASLRKMSSWPPFILWIIGRLFKSILI